MSIEIRACVAVGLLLAPVLHAAGKTAIGLTAARTPIEAVEVGAAGKDARTVVVIGGLDGKRGAVPAPVRGIRLLAIPLGNPEKKQMVFPPAGVAYKENPESHYLWRWILTTAPDLVVISGKEDGGLAQALKAANVPVSDSVPKAAGVIEMSPAHREMERRLARSPRQVALAVAKFYGHDFNEAVYIPAMALIARVRLGERADVERIVAPFVMGAKDSLAKATPSHLSGHLLFAELGNVELVRRAADLAAGPTAIYNEMSDGVFMGCPILAKAGKLTGDEKYFDLSLKQLRYMQKLCLRPDGIYRHSPLDDAAWGRGNAFPAIGTALALSEIPPGHAAYQPMLQAFQQHIAALAKFQTEEGMWRQVVDLPGAYSEFSATAMIGTAMQRGITNGWLDKATYAPRVEKAWQAISRRTGDDGSLVDVCESTGKQKSVDDYLRRGAILGRDPRGGGMVLYFATELVAR